MRIPCFLQDDCLPVPSSVVQSVAEGILRETATQLLGYNNIVLARLPLSIHWDGDTTTKLVEKK